MGNINAISLTESTLSDSEFDSCDLHDVKFIPNVSAFVLETQENVPNSHIKKSSKTKREHKSSPFGNEYDTCAVVGTLENRSYAHQQKENYERYFASHDDVPTAFNTGRLLPEFPELRDSYDQFCTMSESSRDDMDGKLSNKGSKMSVLSELKSSRGMRDSQYSSDESVHACKRRRKANLEHFSDADVNNHRWSMPEFTKLWHENCEGDLDFYFNGRYDSQKDGSSYSEQSTQTCSTPALSNRTSCESLLKYPTAEEIKSVYQNGKEENSEDKEKIIPGESKSSPTLVTNELFDARDYGISGYFEDNGDESVSSSSIHSRDSVNTVEENPQWHGYKADLKDSGIYEDVDGSASVDEINVYPNASGYSEVSNKTRHSPQGEETKLSKIEEKVLDKLKNPRHFTENLHENSNARAGFPNGKGFEIDDKGHVCELEPHSKHTCTKKTHSNVRLEKETLGGEKNKRCAQLMQEYVVTRALDSYAPSSSFYRTSAV